MANKVYTINIEDENLTAENKTTKSKTIKTKQVDVFGVEEINNTGAVKKMKNKTEKGFEKNIVETKKRCVKQKVNEVEDYFDFCFKKGEVMVETKKETIEIAKETVAECVDTDAYVVMNLARMGSLFGCDKRVINA